MKTKLTAATLIAAVAVVTSGTQAEDINTHSGKLSFTHDFANGYCRTSRK